ncbi:hypothetical protein TRQ7_08730 [Thermotoga sp. RQ7]|uniref:hypothetical protein n=1 Tax=Thermotoga sp. RQ7 TaxID=126738 RepID=UPI0005A36C84|nr:hypothetical protein [Thermotoga sp. RQ7]AJG41527.1 hypothetical protein TRQ7_08730 [Thermotoga sp. RQ7]
MKKWGLGVFIVVLFSLSFSITTYRYDSETGRWEKEIREDILVFPSTPEQAGSVVATESFRGRAQWYYYMEYTLGDGEQIFSFWMGQSTDVGTVTIWNDSDFFYVKVELDEGWFLKETHLNIQTDEPEGNQSPGQFPFKEEFDPPVKDYTYRVPLSFLLQKSISRSGKASTRYYVLLHGVVGNGTEEETAWGGRRSNCVEIHLSGTKVTWFVKKPGVYVSKVLEVSASRDLHVFVSLPDPASNSKVLELKLGTGEQIPSEWFDELDFVENRFFLWQKITVSRDSTADTYISEGVITFTINNSKLYVDTSPEGE